MAEGSRDQGSVGTTDPEEDSPNMIVYRKVSLTLCVLQYVANMKGKTFNESQWPVDRLLAAHWSVLMCLYGTCQEAFSFNHLETSSSLFLSVPLPLQDLPPIALYHHWETTALQCFNKLSIPSMRVWVMRGPISVKGNYLFPYGASLSIAAVWLERESSIGG